MAVKVFSGRRPKSDLPAVRFWIVVYGAIILLALTGLILAGAGYILFLAVPGVPVFAWHLWLVSKREERRQINVEIIATGVLALVAPAAYWTGIGQYDPAGWWLWVLTWLQNAASIVYAYLRLEQRGMETGSPAQHAVEGRRARLCIYHLQPAAHPGPWNCLHPAAASLPPILGTMERDVWGIFQPRHKVETGQDRRPPVDRQHTLDDSIHCHMEALMDE